MKPHKVHSKIESIINLLNKNTTNKDWCIAGGSLAKWTHNSDIDIFCFNKDAYTEILNFLNSNFTYLSESETAVTFADKYKKLQLISFIHPNLSQLFDSFDLNKSQIAVLPNLEVVTTKEFLEPNLRTTNFSYYTPYRFIKYLNTKNFTTTIEHVLKLVSIIQDPPDIIDYYTKQQVDSTDYAEVHLTGFLFSLPPELLDPVLSEFHDSPVITKAIENRKQFIYNSRLAVPSNLRSFMLAKLEPYILSLDETCVFDNSVLTVQEYRRLLSISKQTHPEHFI